ncbi:hypothetical protein D9M69_323650 [compost metagenome]
MDQLVFQRLGLGEVLDQQHQAAVARRQGFLDRRLVQVEPADLPVDGQALLVQVLVAAVDEVFQQAAPGLAEGGQARADHALRADPGQLLHGAVPHEDFLVLGQRADAHRQVLQGLPVVAAQGVEFRGEAGEARVVVLQPALDEVDVLGDVAFAAGLVGQEGFHDVLGHARPHQPGQVRLDAVAQAAQGVGAALVEAQVQVAQGLFHFLLRGLGAERLGQLAGEFLRRAGQQCAALRTADVVHGTGFGGALFLVAGLGEQRDQGEHQHVGRQRGEGGEVPVAFFEHVDRAERRQLQPRHVAQQRQQQGDRPHRHAGQQAGDEAAAVGGLPVQYGQRAGEELQGADEGDDAQVRQFLVGAEQAVEGVAGEDDGHHQHAAGPLQPAVDVALGGRLVQRQHQVVEHHAGQRQGHHDDQPAGRRDAADIGGQRQAGAVGGETEAEGEVIRIQRQPEVQAGPEDRRHRQAHRQQEQRQAPAGAEQRARAEVLGEAHVEHVRHDDRRGEEHQQQGAPRAFGERRMQGVERRLVLHQPEFQAVRAVEHAIQGEHADGAERHHLHQGLEGHRHDQPFMPLAGGDAAGAEEDRHQADQHAEGQAGVGLVRLAGEQADGIGHRLDLQGQHRQHGDQHEQGGQRAGPGAAEAEGEQVGQRRQLERAGDAQHRREQHRREEEGAGHPEVDRQEAVAVLVGQPHGAIERPGAGVHAQRQGVDHRMAHQPARHQAAFGDPGDAEQDRQVDGADQDQLGKAKGRRHRAGSAG